MSEYELNEKNHLCRYADKGWLITKTPLTDKQVKDFKENKLDFDDLYWY